jgi:alkanesulfonate monooxygenase SsuD/methylene tetrahydromethanopterin reductase-like flavin-dependent oxidoreductase (luciferase family)
MTAVWKGERGVGPEPANGRPELLIGGTSDAAYQRAAKYGDGWTMGGGTPDMFAQAREQVESAWEKAGREGKPRTVALFYFALGENAQELARRSLGDYYSFLGDIADQIVQGSAKDADTVKQYLAGFEAAGADEVICFPASPDPRQVELLADAALR